MGCASKSMRNRASRLRSRGKQSERFSGGSSCSSGVTERASERASEHGRRGEVNGLLVAGCQYHAFARERITLFIYLFIYSASFSVLSRARGHSDADYNIAARFPAMVVVEAAGTAAAAAAAATAAAVAAAMAAGWYADVG